MMRLLTAKETAEILAVKLPRVYELARRKDILPVGVVIRLGRQIRFSEAALRQWVEDGGSLGANEHNEVEVSQ